MPIDNQIDMAADEVEDRPSTSTIDANYLQAVDELIVARLGKSPMDFAELSRSCDGVWPVVLARRVEHLSLSHLIIRNKRSVRVRWRLYAPELHLNAAEWYFSNDTAARFARDFVRPDRFTLLCGTPTIAVEAAKNKSPFQLIDRNNLLTRRFPELKPHFVHCDIAELRGNFPRPLCAILDPPWYLDTIISWLGKLSDNLQLGDLIVIPLMKELTKPSARQDRHEIIQFACRLGTTRIIKNYAQYESPLFEREALSIHDIAPHPNWRQADVLIVKVEHSSTVYRGVLRFPTQRPWQTFVIGTQVVQLRTRRRRHQHDFLIRPLQGTRSYVFDSVSARDPRREKIDLLTSRNRAATVGNAARLKYALTILSNDGAARISNQSSGALRSVIDEASIRELESFLCAESSWAKNAYRHT